jgi:hypothetical protein
VFELLLDNGPVRELAVQLLVARLGAEPLAFPFQHHRRECLPEKEVGGGNEYARLKAESALRRKRDQGSPATPPGEIDQYEDCPIHPPPPGGPDQIPACHESDTWAQEGTQGPRGHCPATLFHGHNVSDASASHRDWYGSGEAHEQAERQQHTDAIAECSGEGEDGEENVAIYKYSGRRTYISLRGATSSGPKAKPRIYMDTRNVAVVGEVL